MPKKPASFDSLSSEVFPSRLRDLMGTTVSQSALAEVLGTTRQSVSNYMLGKTSPDWKSLVRIARFFRVSTDYLLGLTDIREDTFQLREICDITGLSENAVLCLKNISQMTELSGKDLTYEIDNLLQNCMTPVLLLHISHARSSVEKMKSEMILLRDADPEKKFAAAVNVQRNGSQGVDQAAEFFRELLEQSFGTESMYSCASDYLIEYIREKETKTASM